MSKFDWFLLAVAAYVAVMSLVRLMRQRQRQTMRRLAEEVRREQATHKAEQGSAGENEQRAA